MREIMTVKNVDNEYIYLTLNVNKVACSSCAISNACSVKSSNGSTFRISKKDVKKELLPIMPGDTVIVDFKHNEATLSLIVYGIPLTGFLLGVILGYILKISDLLSFLLGIGFAGVGALITKLYDKKYKIEIVDVKRAIEIPQNVQEIR
ncbi:SoxR reducing system RseC family protein [Fervidobacterium sp.]